MKGKMKSKKKTKKKQNSTVLLDLGVDLKKIRESKGMSIRDASDAMGFSARSSYSKYENGTSEPTLSMLTKICSGFNLELKVLLVPIKEVQHEHNKDRIT